MGTRKRRVRKVAAEAPSPAGAAVPADPRPEGRAPYPALSREAAGRAEAAARACLARVPEELLSRFPDPSASMAYALVLARLLDECVPEGAGILQALVAERAAHHWVMRRWEEDGGGRATEDLRFHTYEGNRAMEALRQLAARSMPAQQARGLARRTIAVIERQVKDPGVRGMLVREIVAEFTLAPEGAKEGA
jgi:hypothetical protein